MMVVTMEYLRKMNPKMNDQERIPAVFGTVFPNRPIIIRPARSSMCSMETQLR